MTEEVAEVLLGRKHNQGLIPEVYFGFLWRKTLT